MIAPSQLKFAAQEIPPTPARNEYPEGRSRTTEAYPKQRCTAVVPVTPSNARCKTARPYALAFSEKRLHVRFVELNHVGTDREEVLDLFVYRSRIGKGQILLTSVIVVLGLLGHRERAGNRDLDFAIRVCA